jgi:hypothetical protein
MRIRLLAVLLPLLGACAAPPLGLGTGAHLPTTTKGERANGVLVSGGASVGAAEHRRAFQVEGSGGLILTRWFTMEAGLVYSQLSDDTNGEIIAISAFPYLRPRLQLGNVSVAMGVAGLGFGGGGGGIAGGIADVQVGYGTPTWSAYAGAYGIAYNFTGGESTTETSGSQVRVGGEYLMPMGSVKLGVALELYRQHDDLRGGNARVEGAFIGGAVKLKIETGVLE